MELTLTYILSQIFAIITYTLFITTYQLKDRKSILICNFIALVSATISYLFLNAYSGVAMQLIAIIRNIVFLTNKDNNSKNNFVTLIIFFILTTIFTIYTYNGFLSIMPYLGTNIYTYSVWQKNVKTYRWLGIPIEICWLIYNIYIKSLFGIIFESILFTFVIIGIILMYRKKEKNEIR